MSVEVSRIVAVLDDSSRTLRDFGDSIPGVFSDWIQIVGKIEPTPDLVAELSGSYPDIGTEYAETIRQLGEYSKKVGHAFGEVATNRIDGWLAVLTGLIDFGTWLDRDPIKVKDGWLSTSTCAIRVCDIVLTQIMPSRTVIRIDYARSGTSIAKVMETTFESAKYARDAHDKRLADLRVAWIELSSENE